MLVKSIFFSHRTRPQHTLWHLLHFSGEHLSPEKFSPGIGCSNSTVCICPISIGARSMNLCIWAVSPGLDDISNFKGFLFILQLLPLARLLLVQLTVLGLLRLQLLRIGGFWVCNLLEALLLFLRGVSPLGDFSEYVLAADDIVLPTNFEILLADDFDSCVVLHKLVIASVDIVVKSSLL